MKIRIKGNSLRYRLTKTDVAKLAEEGYVQETVDFGSQQLVYALKLVDDEQLSVTYKENAITLYAPKAMIAGFADEDKVGYEGKHGNLHLLVEKDFTCLDEVAEDQSDNYPNPLAVKKI
jgi:predicted nucleotidyltransferase